MRRLWVNYNNDHKIKSIRVIDDVQDQVLPMKDLFKVVVTLNKEARVVELYYKTDWHIERDYEDCPFNTDLKIETLYFNNLTDKEILEEYEEPEQFWSEFRFLVGEQ